MCILAFSALTQSSTAGSVVHTLVQYVLSIEVCPPLDWAATCLYSSNCDPSTQLASSSDQSLLGHIQGTADASVSESSL